MPLIKNPHAPGYILTEDPEEIERLQSLKPLKVEVDIEDEPKAKSKKKKK